MKTKHHLAHSEATPPRTVFEKWNRFTQFAVLALAALTLSPAVAAPTPTQQAYLKASNTGARDEFGWSVAVSGTTAVIGARFESSNATGMNGNQTDDSAPQSGAAYVFVRNGTNWIQQAYLKASNTGSDDNFGFSVAISGDTIVVGAPFEDSNATRVNGDQSDNSADSSGAAYVFVRNGTNWVQQAYLKASNTGGPSPGESFGDTFGWWVAVSGHTVVIGANGEDSNATGVNGNQNNNSAIGSGAAYVFVRSGTNWSQQAYLKASNTGGQAPGESYGDGELTQDKCYRGGSVDEVFVDSLTQVRGYPSNEHESVCQTRVSRPHPRALQAGRSSP